MNTRTTFARGLLAVAALGITVSACAAPRSSTPDAIRAETYTFGDGAGSTGRVFRAVAADGAEALRGVTEIAAEGGTIRVLEDATLDASGRLQRAEIIVSRGCDGPVEEHLVLDRARGTVRAATPGGTVEWSVPADAPWIVEPLARGAVTPITAWIGVRAAASGADLRVVRADRRTSYRTHADQVVIPHELGTTFVLGTVAADADRSFVRGVRPENGAPLRRGTEGAAPLACASLALHAPDVVH